MGTVLRILCPVQHTGRATQPFSCHTSPFSLARHTASRATAANLLFALVAELTAA